MQDKYTENIDQLDSFYQDNLRDISIEPPAAVWDKISVSYSAQKKPAGLFSKKTTLLLLLLFAVGAAVGGFLCFENTKEGNGSVEKSTRIIKEKTENRKEETGKNQETEKSIEENWNRKQKTGKVKVIDGVVNEGIATPLATAPLVETPNPIVVELSSKPDSISGAKEIVPKKKMSFREKHTQNIKSDSLRPLFVPVK